MSTIVTPPTLSVPFNTPITTPPSGTVDGTAVDFVPYAIVLGFSIFPGLENLEQIAGTIRPAPSVVRHAFLSAGVPIYQPVETAPGVFAPGAIVPGAIGLVPHSLLVGYSPEGLAQLAAQRILAAFAAAGIPTDPAIANADLTSTGEGGASDPAPATLSETTSLSSSGEAASEGGGVPVLTTTP